MRATTLHALGSHSLILGGIDIMSKALGYGFHSSADENPFSITKDTSTSLSGICTFGGTLAFDGTEMKHLTQRNDMLLHLLAGSRNIAPLYTRTEYVLGKSDSEN